MKQNPLLACCVIEAALHASADYRGPPGVIVDAAGAAVGRLDHASTTCMAAAVAVPILADAIAAQTAAAGAAAARAAVDQYEARRAAAAGAAADRYEAGRAAAKAAIQTAGSQLTAAAAAGPAAPHAHGSNRAEKKLYCTLVAALKYVQASAALQGPAEAVMHTFYNATELLCACSSAVTMMLRSRSQLTMDIHTMPASAPAAAVGTGAQLHSELQQQLLWLDVLGRLLVAARQLLQQVPQRVSTSGDLVLESLVLPKAQQFAQYAELMQALLMTMAGLGIYGVLRHRAAVPTALLVAATQADCARLLQQARGLQEQVHAITMLFQQSSGYGAEGLQSQQRLAGTQALRQLRAACQQGGLPQQLHDFGVAYCAAFPQRGCCGNPGCTNLDKLTETALASQGCSGCGKVSMRIISMWTIFLRTPLGVADCRATRDFAICLLCCGTGRASTWTSPL